MDLVDTLPDVGYWSKILTVPSPPATSSLTLRSRSQTKSFSWLMKCLYHISQSSESIHLSNIKTLEGLLPFHNYCRVHMRQGHVRNFLFFSRSGNCQGIPYCVREKWNFAKMSGNCTFQSWSERKEEIFFFKIMISNIKDFVYKSTSPWLNALQYGMKSLHLKKRSFWQDSWDPEKISVHLVLNCI